MSLPPDSITVHSPVSLSDSDWHAWSELQQAYSCFDAPSFRPEFVGLLASLRPYLRIAVAKANGRSVGFLPLVIDSHGHGYPPGQWLMSFQGPVCDPRFVIGARMWLDACGLRQLRFDRLVVPNASFANDVVSTAQSPLIDLSRGYAGYKYDLRSRGSKLIKRLEQKRRHAERLLSSLELADEAMFPDSLELLVSWRRERNRTIMAADFLGVPWVTQFMRVLCEQRQALFRGRLFVLRLGHSPAAALLAIQSRNVLECVVTAFNPDYAVYSPGLLLFHQVVREAADHGIERIHLTRGTEHFKERFENDWVSVADAIVGQSAIAREVLRTRLAVQRMVWQTPLGRPMRRLWRRAIRTVERITVCQQTWVDPPVSEAAGNPAAEEIAQR